MLGDGTKSLTDLKDTFANADQEHVESVKTRTLEMAAVSNGLVFMNLSKVDVQMRKHANLLSERVSPHDRAVMKSFVQQKQGQDQSAQSSSRHSSNKWTPPDASTVAAACTVQGVGADNTLFSLSTIQIVFKHTYTTCVHTLSLGGAWVHEPCAHVL